MKLLGPVFEALQQKTMQLVSTFSEDEIKTIERYFKGATAIMQETANDLNKT